MKNLLKKMKTLAALGIAMGLAITPTFAGLNAPALKNALGGGVVANPTPVQDTDLSKLCVNSAWTAESTLPDGFFWGQNAFATMDDAIAKMDAATEKIILKGDVTLGNTEKMYLKHDLVIEGNGYTINRVVYGSTRLNFEILCDNNYALTYKVTFDNVQFKGLTSNMNGVFYMSTNVDVANESLIDVYQLYNTGTLTLSGNSKIEASDDIVNNGTIRFVGEGTSETSECSITMSTRFTNNGTLEFSNMVGYNVGGLDAIMWNDGSTLALTGGTKFDFSAEGQGWDHGLFVDKSSQVMTDYITLQSGEKLTLAYNDQATGDDRQIKVNNAINTSEGSVVVDMTGCTADSYTVIYGGDGSDYGENLTVTGAVYMLKQVGNDLVAVKAVCQIFDTGVKYDSLTNALIAVQNGQTIQMLVASTAETLPACSVYGGPKTFTLQGLTDGDGYTEIAGATGDATVENVTNTFRNINWTKPFSNRNLFKADFDFCKFTGEGGVVNARASGGATSQTQAVWVFQACEFEQTGATAVQFDEGKNVRVTFQLCDIRGKVCGLTVGYNNDVTFVQCNLDGSVEDSEGKYFAEVTCPAAVSFVYCTFTERFIAGVTAAKNAGNNGINIPDGSSYMFLYCSSGMAALVGEVGTGSTALISSDVEMAIFADGVTALNQVLTGYAFPTITGMDTLTGRVKYDFSTLTADSWSNGSTNYAATLSGTLTIPEGLTFSVADKATVAENTVIRLAAVQGGEAYNTWLASNLTAEQAANAMVAGWVASIGDTKYYTLADALTAVKANETVKLLCNLTETTAVTAPALAFSLDLAGFNYTNSVGFATQNGYTIMLTDSTEPAAATKFCVTAITGAGSIAIDTTANVALDNVTSAASITNNGTFAAEVFTLSNALVSTGTLALKDSTINVDDSSTKHTTTEGSSSKYDVNNPIWLKSDSTLTNATISETFASNNTENRVRGLYVTGTGADVDFVTEEGKTTSIIFDRDKTRSRSQTGWGYGIYLGGGSDDAVLSFIGAGDLNLAGRQQGGGDPDSPYGYIFYGVLVNGEDNELTFANEGKTSITASSAYGVNGLVNKGTTEFSNGTVLVNTYVDGGVGFSNNRGLYNSYGDILVTSDVDDMTVFTEGAAYLASPASGDISDGAAAIYGDTYDGGSIVINAKKLNVLAVSGEDTAKEWEIGGTKVTGHTTYSAEKAAEVGEGKYSTSFGIKNEGMDTITVGADTLTNIRTRDFHKNSVAVGAVAYDDGSGYIETNGGIELLGNTTIVAEGGDGTKAIYAIDGNFITIGSEGKTVSITGDIYAAGKGITTNDEGEELPSTITLAGDENTVAGSLTVTNGAVANLDNTVLTGSACSVYANSTLNLSNSTIKVATFANEGTVMVDMAGFTGESLMIVEITGTEEKTLADFGNVTLTNSNVGAYTYITTVIGNDLYALIPNVTFTPTAVDNVNVKVYTNDAPVEKTGDAYVITSNETAAVVVYEAYNGYYYADGTAVKTNVLDTTVNPAVMAAVAPDAPAQPTAMVKKPVQRYPWNGKVDVTYRLKNWPAGRGVKFVIKVGETEVDGGTTMPAAGGSVTGSYAIDLKALNLPANRGEATIKAVAE